MKNLLNNTTIKSNINSGITQLYNSKSDSSKSEIISSPGLNLNTFETVIGRESLLTPKANAQMIMGQIPDLWKVCLDLFSTFFVKDAPYSALQFVPVLKSLQSIDEIQRKRFLRNPETNHVLIENELFKVVLIHWKSGKISSIHGHPAGGCVFKVLQGQLEELRYTADASPKLLSSSTYIAGSMAYIDDQMGYHAVGNPFNTPAISLHVYTPGKK